VNGDVKALRKRAEVVREYGPLADVERVHGVTFDGTSVWLATGDRLQSLEPESGRPGRAIAVAADAGTAFDGRPRSSRRCHRRPPKEAPA
jgi:hypothetical protein